MKKFGLLIVTLILMCFVTTANAETIGVANYKKIEENYKYAQNAYKQIDNKVLELQQFVIDKDKEYKAIDSPLQKKNFEDKMKTTYKNKEDSLLKLQLQKQDEIYSNILNATKAVAKDKKIDIVLDYRVIFVGGTDISDDIIKYLNSNPTPKK